MSLCYRNYDTNLISYCFYIVCVKIGYLNVNLKVEKIFIKIRNSFPKHVERLITPIHFHLLYVTK